MTNPTIGLKNAGYFKLVNVDDGINVPSYAAFSKIKDAISAKITPKTSSETQWADDAPVDIIQSLGEVTVEIDAREVPISVQADLLGHTFTGGKLVKKSTDIAPFICFAFMAMKADRTNYRYDKLYKGKFELIESTNETVADKTKTQTRKLKGTFIKRIYDDQWEAITDTDEATYVTALGTNWFSYVDNPSDLVPPTVSTIVPALNATAIAISSTVVITFSEAIQNAIASNLFIAKATDGSIVAATLAVNAAGTIVTIAPSSNLTAATAYYVYATTNIKDINGNALAATYVSKFTTA